MSRSKTTRLRKSASRPRKCRQKKRHGFTLVELMVSIVLVVLLLLMYATVFEQAATVISTLRAVGKNDDRSRMLSIVLKDDLNRRTFQTVIPFDIGTVSNAFAPTNNIAAMDERRGYFSISENDPTDNTDDVLAFTVRIPNKDKEALYLGKATFLKDKSDSDPDDPDENDPLVQSLLVSNWNQPENDDGQFENSGGILNRMGASPAAEVVYFLRNGTLYRRILLVRDPYPLIPSPPPPSTPKEITGDFTEDNLRSADRVGASFWNYFDYSVFYNRFRVVTWLDPSTGMTVTTGEPAFHGPDSLLNNSIILVKDDTSTINIPLLLSNPYLRFGSSLSNLNTADSTLSDPRPREFDSAGSFIGRFMMQETSHSAFGSPGSIPVGGDPFAFTTPLNLNNNGVVSAYSTEPIDRRRGEDILLNHVHSFDIKVWDDGLNPPRWVDLGHRTDDNNDGVLEGNYSWTAAKNSKSKYHDYDPASPDPLNPDPIGFRYDTWTPFNSPHIGLPPFRPTADLDGDSIIDPSNGSPDVLRLKAIQITIRFLDEASGKMRQLTIQHALDNNSNN